VQKFFANTLYLLTRKEKVRAAGLLVLVVFMALLETAGVASILPFLAVLSDPQIIQDNAILNTAYRWSGVEGTQDFLILLGGGVLGFIIIANVSAVATHWFISRYTNMRAHSIACRLLSVYIRQPYPFFLKQSSSDMAKNILTEVTHVVKNIIVTTMQIIAKIIVSLCILGLLITVDPQLALIVLGVLGAAFGVIYLLVHKRLSALGKLRADSTTMRYKIFSEIFASIKDIKILGHEDVFIKRFRQPSYDTSKSYVAYEVISVAPRYILETLAFGGILIILLYLMIMRQESTAGIIPVIGLYAFAGQRLLPAMQAIFLNASRIRYAIPSLDHLCDELRLVEKALPSQPREHKGGTMPLNHTIKLENIHFRFEEAGQPVLNGISMEIPAHTKIALVGSTGAGKSTLMDILLGLLTPDKGRMLVDDVPVTPENVRSWQNNIGYVSQNIVLLNDTIARNIAFAQDEGDIDMERVRKVAAIAQLEDFIDTETPQGYETHIGENGVRLSGGQRQRLGLARALYPDPSVLVLDEATSALDNITESKVMAAMDDIARDKTVIMIAHRLSTVQKCDCVFYLSRGEITAQGSYEELLENSEEFRALTQSSEYTNRSTE